MSKQDKLIIREIEIWGKYKRNDGGFIVRWSKNGLGFGEASFYKKDNILHCNSEKMGKEFIKEILAVLAEEVIIED